MPRKSFRRKNGRRRTVRRAVRRVKRRNFKRAVRSAAETKLIKHIDDNSGAGNTVKILDSTCNVFCPYYRISPKSATMNNNEFITHFVNHTGTPPDELRNFIEVGANYNQRIGRKVRLMGTTLQIHGFFDNNFVGAGREYPMYASMRVVQGWVKGGYEHLTDLMVGGDRAGAVHGPQADYSMYSEIPFSKYKIIKDYIITRYPRSPFAAPGSAQDIKAAYKPVSIKAHWSGQDITFQDSLPNSNERGWSGWCPFLMLLNPNADNGDETAKDKLNFSIDFCKLTIPFKDA